MLITKEHIEYKGTCIKYKGTNIKDSPTKGQTTQGQTTQGQTTQGQTTQGQTTKSQKMRQKGKFFLILTVSIFLLLFKVRLGTFWAERCAQNRLGSRALRPRVRLVKTLSGPSAAARTGQGAERYGHMVNYIHLFIIIQGQVRLRHFLGRALRLGWARGPSAAATGQVS